MFALFASDFKEISNLPLSVSAFMHNGSLAPGQQQQGMMQQAPAPVAAPAAPKAGLFGGGGLFGGMAKMAGAAPAAPQQQQM